MSLKKNMIMLLVLCFSIGTVTLIFSTPIYACSCVEPLSVEEQLSHSDTVFAGRVIEIKDSKENGRNTKAVRFKVDEIWMGGNESQIIIYTGSGGGDCGIAFQEGTDYIVYAQSSKMYGDKELLVTIMCDRTKPLVQAKEDLDQLGKGNPPTNIVNLESKNFKKSIEPQVESKRESVAIWITVAGIAVLLLVIFIVKRKSRK